MNTAGDLRRCSCPSRTTTLGFEPSQSFTSSKNSVKSRFRPALLPRGPIGTSSSGAPLCPWHFGVEAPRHLEQWESKCSANLLLVSAFLTCAETISCLLVVEKQAGRQQT